MGKPEEQHKRAFCTFHSNSKIPQHVHQYDHNMDFENVNIIDRAKNYHKRLLYFWKRGIPKDTPTQGITT